MCLQFHSFFCLSSLWVVYVSELTSENPPHAFLRLKRLYIPVVFSLLALQGLKNVSVNILLIPPPKLILIHTKRSAPENSKGVRDWDPWRKPTEVAEQLQTRLVVSAVFAYKSDGKQGSQDRFSAFP